jgi:hypothetical protein
VERDGDGESRWQIEPNRVELEGVKKSTVWHHRNINQTVGEWLYYLTLLIIRYSLDKVVF